MEITAQTHFQSGLYTLVFLMREGKLLLLKRNKDPNMGKYNGVGGKVERHETLHDSAKRELLEESGYLANQLQLRAILRFVEEDGLEYCVFAFLCTDFTGELKESDEGSLHWVESPYSMDLVENIPVFLPHILTQTGVGEFHFYYPKSGPVTYNYLLHNGNSSKGEIIR